MDADKHLRNILDEIQNGALNVDQGIEKLRDLPFLDIGHTKIDLHRSLRNGFPEVIYADGKTPEQVGEIFSRISL